MYHQVNIKNKNTAYRENPGCFTNHAVPGQKRLQKINRMHHDL